MSISAKSILLTATAIIISSCSDAPFEPINVQGGVFFDQTCPRSHVIYTVPDGKLLILEDASASANESATASIPNNPGIVENVPITLSLRTNPTGTISFGSADHIVVGNVGLPVSGGRKIKGYAAPGTNILYLIGGCTVDVNTRLTFSGHLVDFP